MEITTLTSDRMFLLTFLFWMFAGCLLIFPILFTAMSASQFIWGPPADRSDVINLVKSVASLVVALAIAYGALRLGMRDREVVLAGNAVEIRWGVTMPLTLRHIEAAAFTDFAVTKEKWVALSMRSSAGHYGSLAKPDRWRLTATANGRTVNLGSYTTEEDAQRAIALVQAAGKSK